MKKALITLAVAAAILGGCNKNKSTTKHAKADLKTPTTQSVAAAPTTRPSVSHPLAGAWSMAIPRQNAKGASITAWDATHVTIKAGDLSGDYVVQGNYLLILTRDESRRTIAWRINSNDSLTVVRGPKDCGSCNGITLVRAADSATADASSQSSDESYTDESSDENATGQDATTEVETGEIVAD